MLLAGASAVGVGTATFLDPRATLRIVEELDAWCAQQRRRARARPDRSTEVLNGGNTMDVRNRLATRARRPDLDRAEQLAKEVAPWFGVAKVGLELYSAAGPEAIARMRALDFDVFADIKLHDIPTTVGRAARVLGRQGRALSELPRRGRGRDVARRGRGTRGRRARRRSRTGDSRSR